MRRPAGKGETMIRVLALGLSVLLSGCALGPPIMKSNSIAYGEVIDDMTNKLLVMP